MVWFSKRVWAVCGLTAVLVASGVVAFGQPCEPQWHRVFGLNGVGNPPGSSTFPLNGIFAAVVDHTGEVAGGQPRIYGGGFFQYAGGRPANSVAAWDGGRDWFPMGNGLGHEIRAMAIFDPGGGVGPSVFAGGHFLNPANFARWTGTQWVAVPGTGDGNVQAMLVFDDGQGSALYLGRGTLGANPPVRSVVRWNGQSMTLLGSPASPALPADVRCLIAFDHDGVGHNPPTLYISGRSNSSGVSIARWDGADWVSLGQTPSGDVTALEWFDPDGGGPGPMSLYAGGTFTLPGASEPVNLARWDGTQWHEVPTGSAAMIRALRSWDDGSGSGPALYIGGDFAGAGGVASRGVVRFDGAEFTSMAGGVIGNSTMIVHALVPYHDFRTREPRLLVGGRYSSAGMVASHGAAVWNGSHWLPAGTGAPLERRSGEIAATVQPGFPVAISGRTATFPLLPSYLACAVWDGHLWRVLDGNFNGPIIALRWVDLEDGQGPMLYAGGSFSEVDGQPAAYIARFDGQQWHSLGSGLESTNGTAAVVRAITSYRPGPGLPPVVVVAGAFRTTGDAPLANIAAWNGRSWSSVGGGLEVTEEGSIRTLITLVEDGIEMLYTGGSLLPSDTFPGGAVARWDGSSWTPLGDLQGWSSRLAPSPHSADGTRLYALGGFSSGATVPGSHSVVRWDGQAWHPLGSHFGSVGAFPFDPDGKGPRPAALFTAEFSQLAAVRFWTGTAWQNLVPALRASTWNTAVNALHVYESAELGPVLLVEGAFHFLGNSEPAGGLIFWGGCARCPADYNNDGAVNSADIAAFIQSWLSALAGQPIDADFNRDGVVNSADISAFIAAWLSAIQTGC